MRLLSLRAESTRASFGAARAPGTALPEYSGPPGFVDPYTDPLTGRLRHLLSPAMTAEEFERAEGDLVASAALELDSRPVDATYDLEHLQEIHRRLFEDVYPFAGRLRTVDIRKAAKEVDVVAPVPFMPVGLMARGLGFALDELSADQHLQGLKKGQFVDRLAHHYDQVNYAHPFREGNGRTQRIFWSQVATSAGYDIDWRAVSGKVNDDASRVAIERGDLTELKAMFERIVEPAGAKSQKPATSTLEQVRELQDRCNRTPDHSTNADQDPPVDPAARSREQER